MTNIRQLRIKANLSQARPASELNVTQGAVPQWECGKSRPTSHLYPKLAKILGCTIDDLFDDKTA